MKKTDSFENAKGKIEYTLLNDVIFHYIFENDDFVLRKLLCALLHLKPSEIKSIKIKNPINYGDYVEEKKFILDLSLILNNTSIVNLELQIINEYDWPERSLSYLCRSFNTLNKGDDYIDVMPSYFIGILDFSLFKDAPEFFSTYHLRNDKTSDIYTSKFALSVLDLTQIKLATEEDKSWNIDKWAALFKATTWEELRMIASSDQEMQKAATLVYHANQDEIAREWAWRHEEALRIERARNARHKKKEEYFKTRDAEISMKLDEISRREDELSRRDDELSKRDNELSARDNELSRRDDELSRREIELSRREEEFRQRLADNHML